MSFQKTTGSSELPKMFIGGSYLGDFQMIEEFHNEGILADLVKKASAYSVANVKV